MTNENYMQMLTVIDEIAKTANDAFITQQAAHARLLTEETHIPTLALAGIGASGRSLLAAAEAICGVALPTGLAEAMEKKAACVTVTYGEAGMTADASGELVCSCPSEVLKDRRILLCNGNPEDTLWQALLENADTLVLRVNATAAMSQSERTWMDQMLIPSFGKEHFGVWVDLMDQLNTDSDREDMCKAVQHALDKRSLPAPLFPSAEKAGTWMLQQLQSMDVQDSHCKKALRICLEHIRRQLECILQSATVSSEAIEKATTVLQSQRASMELLGEIAVTTTISNTYVKMKVDAREGIQDFNAQAADSICQKIESAQDKELETLEPKIQTYLQKIWERYQQEMSDKLNQESTACYNRLMEQMERDAEKLISDMDEETRRVLDAAINRPVQEQSGALIRPDWQVQGANSLVKLRTETRNLMLLSIPLVLVSPWLSVATFIGARFYKKTQEAKRGKEFRDTMTAQVRSSCSAVAEDIQAESERNIDAAAAQLTAAVREAYTGLTDKLIQELAQLSAQQQAASSRLDSLQQLRSVTIPGLICNL